MSPHLTPIRTCHNVRDPGAIEGKADMRPTIADNLDS
jgi:hypothetical protein